VSVRASVSRVPYLCDWWAGVWRGGSERGPAGGVGRSLGF
jgi:hypothetical protein